MGVNQLHSLLLAAAPVLDAAAWQAASLTLQAVCLPGPWQLESTAAAMGGSSGGSLLAAAVAAESIRRRSRLAVLLQRVLDSLLGQRAAVMPGQVQLQLLELLHRTVLEAAATNADAGYRLATGRVLAAGARLAAQGGLGKGREAWALAADTTAGAGEAAMGGHNTTLAAGPTAVGVEEEEEEDPAGPESAAIASWEQLRPALVRQEAEGGCLYIAALQRCVHAPASSNGTEAAVAAECEARLANFCLWVVQGAAERVAGADHAADATAAAAALAASPGASQGPGTPAAAATNGVAALNPADQPWDDAVR